MYEINEIPSNSTVYLNDINKFIDEYFGYNIPLSDMDYYQVFNNNIFMGYLINFSKIYMYFPNGIVKDAKVMITNEMGEVTNYSSNFQYNDIMKNKVGIAYSDKNGNDVFYKVLVLSNDILEYKLINMINKKMFIYQFNTTDYIDKDTGKLVVPKSHLNEPCNAHYKHNCNSLYNEYWYPITIDKNDILNYIKAMKVDSENIIDFLRLIEVTMNNDMPEIKRYIQVNTLGNIKLPFTDITSKYEYQEFINSQVGTCFDWHITGDVIDLFNGTNDNINDMYSIIEPLTLNRTKNL